MTTNDLPAGEHVLTEWLAIRDTSNPEVDRTIRRTPCVDVDHGDGSGASLREYGAYAENRAILDGLASAGQSAGQG